MLRLRIVDRLEAEVDGAAVAMPPGGRACALIGWLALHPGPHPRREVAASLWPEMPNDRALANLRTALWAVHRSWGPAGRYVEATRSGVGLVEDDIWVDALQDDATIAGHLLPGLADEWAASARDERRRAALDALVERADTAERDGDLSEAVRLNRELCRLCPIDENAHRSLLQRLLLAGDRASAVLASRDFADRLASELGVRPSVPTRAAHARAQAGVARSPRPRLLGRAEEVAGLTSLWHTAARGDGQVVVLVGEAGIGKSSLIAELTHRVETSGGTVAAATGADAAGRTPFSAWLELCDGLAASAPPVPQDAGWPRELNRLSPGLGGRLGHPGPPASVAAPELERLRVFESVLRLVEWSCLHRPTMLVLDDAHRVDGASLRLTAHVARRLAALPVLLVVAHRGGALPVELTTLIADLTARGPVVEVAVRPLDAPAAAALATSVQSLGVDAVRKVVAAAEGNPLLVVESSQALARGGADPPANLRTAVRASCGRMPTAGVRLVQLLAVAGRPLSPPELDRLEIDGVDALEAAAAAEGLLARRGGSLGFRHELLRAAVSAEIVDPVRLHERIATAVDPSRHADVAHHLAAAGRPGDAAAQWAAAAADARRVGALAEARDFLTRATDAAPADGRLWLELQEVCAWSGRHLEAEPAWDRAVALLPVPDLAAAWCRRGRQLRSVRCDPAASMSAYSVAHDLLTRWSAPRLRADVLLGLAWGDAVAGDGRRHEELLERAERLLPDSLDVRVVSDVVEIRMQGLIRRGLFARAAGVALRAPPHAVSARFPDRAFAVLVNAACALSCAGDRDGSLALADRAVEATAALPAVLIGSLAARAQLLARLGRHEEAADTARRQLALAQRLDAPGLVATTFHDVGLVALAAGRYRVAATHLDRALAAGARVSRPTAGLRCAEALVRSGDPAGARQRLRTVLLDPVGRADQPWSLLPQIAYVRGLVAAAEGDPDTARARFDEARDAWRRVLGSVTARTADGYLAHLVDLGRPPVTGLVEPECELDRIQMSRQVLPAGRSRPTRV
ncbi:MAG: transcriptional activator domain [Aeromicrobium sp.]|nr:transcriptional activator domain [Aeromicrobium sp.]